MKKFLLGIVCLVLVGCGKSFDVEKAVKNVDALSSNSTLGYNVLEEVSKEDMKNLYSIDASKADYMMFKKTKDSNEVDLYMIVKVKDDKIEEKIDAYFETLELQCEMYDQENAAKVKNRLEDKVDGYNIYIISNDNELVLKTIKNS